LDSKINAQDSKINTLESKVQVLDSNITKLASKIVILESNETYSRFNMLTLGSKALYLASDGSPQRPEWRLPASKRTQIGR
jgi:hypothetical protein